MTELTSSEEIIGVPEPKIIQIGDVSCIGVTHAGDLTKQKIPPQPFTDLVKNAHYLMKESRAGNIEDQGIPAGYDDIAEVYFSGEKKDHIYFLEDGVDKGELAERYGIPPNIYLLGRTIAQLDVIKKKKYENLDHWQRRREASRLIRSTINLSERVAQMREEDIDNVRNLAFEYADVIFDPSEETERTHELANSIQGALVMSDFMSGVRDYEVFAPKVKRFSTTLDGPKAIVVGRNHLPAIEKVLRGEQLEQPPMWNSYIQSKISGPNQTASANFTKIANEGF